MRKFNFISLITIISIISICLYSSVDALPTDPKGEKELRAHGSQVHDKIFDIWNEYQRAIERCKRSKENSTSLLDSAEVVRGLLRKEGFEKDKINEMFEKVANIINVYIVLVYLILMLLGLILIRCVIKYSCCRVLVLICFVIMFIRPTMASSTQQPIQDQLVNSYSYYFFYYFLPVGIVAFVIAAWIMYCKGPEQMSPPTLNFRTRWIQFVSFESMLKDFRKEIPSWLNGLQNYKLFGELELTEEFRGHIQQFVAQVIDYENVIRDATNGVQLQEDNGDWQQTIYEVREQSFWLKLFNDEFRSNKSKNVEDLMFPKDDITFSRFINCPVVQVIWKSLLEDLQMLVVAGKIRIGDVRPAIKSSVQAVRSTIGIVTVDKVVSNKDDWYDRFGNLVSSKRETEDYHVLSCRELINEIYVKLDSMSLAEITDDTMKMLVRNSGRYLLTDEEWSDNYRYVLPKIRYIHLMSRVEQGLVDREYDENIERLRYAQSHYRRISYLKHEQRKYKYIWEHVNWRQRLVMLLTLMLPVVALIIMASIVYPITGLSLVVTQSTADDSFHAHKLERPIYGMMSGYEAQGMYHDYKNYSILKEAYGPDEVEYDWSIGTQGLYNRSVLGFSLNSKINAEAALKHRNLVKVSDYEEFNATLVEKYALEIAEEFKSLTEFTEGELSFDDIREFISSRPGYNQGRVKAILNEVWKIEGKSEEDKLSSRVVETFIKDEYYCENKRPRNIMSCNKAIIGIVGAILEPINQLYFTRPQTIKHVPVNVRPQYIEEYLGESKYIYQTDYSAFEASQNSLWITHGEMKFLSQLYKIYYPLLNKVLNADVRKVLVGGKKGEQGLWLIENMRMSGFPDTSFGNTLHNEIMLRIIELETGAHLKYLVEGDDGLIVSDKELDIEFVTKLAKGYGIGLKMERKESLNSAGFLSTIWDPKTKYTDVMNRANYLRKLEVFRPHKVKKFGLVSLLKSRLLSALTYMGTSEPLYELAKKLQELYPDIKARREKNFWSYHSAMQEGQDIEVLNDMIEYRPMPLEKFVHKEEFENDYIKYENSRFTVKKIKEVKTLKEWVAMLDYLIQEYDFDHSELCMISGELEKIPKEVINKNKGGKKASRLQDHLNYYAKSY